MKFLSTVLVVLLSVALVRADATTETPPPNGLRENTPRVFALTNARIVQAAGRVIERGSIVVRDGRIEAVGASIEIPGDARIFDFNHKTIYPGLIDSYSELPRDASKQDPTLTDGLGAKYWNSQIVPQVRASRIYRIDLGANDQLRRAGIVARYVAPSFGIIKGRGALVSTGDEKLAEAFINPNGHLHIRLTQDATPGGQYPDSPMGAYALVRQAMYDAQWYQSARKSILENPSLGSIETNDALESLQDVIDGRVTVSIDAPDEMYGLRVKTIADEFKLNAVRRGSGYEYRLASQMASTPSVIPLNFPKAPDVSSPEKARAVSLENLMHWDLAPENAARLTKANGAFVFSSTGLREIDKWIPQLRLTVERGLDRDEALRALTERAAQMYGSEKEIGTLDVGKRASFIVTDGELFDAKTKLLETWVNGQRFANGTDRPDPRGTWKAEVGGQVFTLKITGELGDLKATYEPIASATTQPSTQPTTAPTGKIEDVKFASGRISFNIKDDPALTPGIAVASASVGDDLLEGTILYPSAVRVAWKAVRQKDSEESTTNPPSSPTTQDAPTTKHASFEPTWPLGAYGRNGLPEQAKVVIFDHVTIWPANRREPFVGSVRIENGKIVDVQRDPEPTTKPTSSPTTQAASAPTTQSDVSVEGILRDVFEMDFSSPSPSTIPATQPASARKGFDSHQIDFDRLSVATIAESQSVPLRFIHIDGQNGKLHLTPGIIDAHSHIASDGGINEGGQAVTCEVRIGDFIDPTDISIYRQLAGGVTSANILHGSANP
ncbi:MAG TPA: amidohydrolase family protein, partial [Tepidisphaeraceae bacterium]|nr:amidohydrolase family protein [Tepidisphaeraceae bacterium]